jgi:hypothetical protein
MKLLEITQPTNAFLIFSGYANELYYTMLPVPSGATPGIYGLDDFGALQNLTAIVGPANKQVLHRRAQQFLTSTGFLDDIKEFGPVEWIEKPLPERYKNLFQDAPLETWELYQPFFLH